VCFKHNAEALLIICSIDSEWMSVIHTTAFRNVSSHFEHLENCLRVTDIGDFIVHPRTVTVPWGSESAVRRRWLSFCIFDRHISYDRSSRSGNIHQCAIPFYSSRAGFGIISHQSSLSAPLQHRFGSLRLMGFAKVKIAVTSEICECDGHTVLKLSQRRLTADCLDLQEKDYLRMRSKVPSDCLISYIKANGTVLEIFNIVGHFPDSPRTQHCILSISNGNVLCLTLTILIFAHS